MSIPNAIQNGWKTNKRTCQNCECIIHYKIIEQENGDIDLEPIEKYYGNEVLTDSYGRPILENGQPQRVEVLHETRRCATHEGLELNALHQAILTEDEVLKDTMVELIDALDEADKEDIIDPDTQEPQGKKFKIQPLIGWDEHRNLHVRHPASTQKKNRVITELEKKHERGKVVFDN